MKCKLITNQLEITYKGDEIMEKLVFSVDDIMKLLDIGRNQAYQLVNSGEFPTRKVGRKILIPKAGFMKWLEG